ncbi:DUF1294 domain-containing protein [Paludibacterium paludis]|uniref:DUF1294 domain-containing protein n=1 Tax=Paludibacterium paludis TaxID=1225769 RepID=A0A918NZU3_9NEIS|nr:DUF1294 domain-containing protein [Paludibacterium paludis]GGY09678.1 hypothetical protein GCM10011289_10670 [Paludibacterium paludis]
MRGLSLAGGFPVLVMSLLAWMRELRWPVQLYLAAGCLTFILYSFDKWRAVRGGRRVPETTLHLMELAGGWPGALIAQRLLRHKCSKSRYQWVFWLIVAVHYAAWGAWFWVAGR